MSTATDIIDALGGTIKVAAALDLTPSTVSSWKTANFIPDWRQSSVLALAKRMKDKLPTPITAADFPPKEDRNSRADKAA